MDAHTRLSLEFDRPLLQDVFDAPDLRYVSLYLFSLRKDLFQDLLDDNVNDSIEALYQLDDPTIGDLKRLCDQALIKALVQFRVIPTLKNIEALDQQADDHKIRLVSGLKLLREEISVEEEELHILVKEDYLERLIAPNIPEMTQIRLHAAMERLRGMMCPHSAAIHELVHKYSDFYALDDDFYYIIEELGNPFQALRIELLIRAMVERYKEIKNRTDEILAQFDPQLPKAEWIKKIKTAKSKNQLDFAKYLKEKSRKTTFPLKFRVEFKTQYPPIYKQWVDTLNALLLLKLQLDDIGSQLEQLTAYYTGKKQIMSYIEFIEKTSFDDSIADSVSKLLTTVRNALKSVNDALDSYSKKDIKSLNLDVERLLLDLGLEDEEETE